MTIENVWDILQGVSVIVTGASAIVAATPTPKDDSALAKVRKGLEVLALMVGFARRR